MDGNNWRPAPQPEPTMVETPDWRTTLQPDSRHRIVNKIMDALKRHLPNILGPDLPITLGPEGINKVNKIAVMVEEKIYTTANSQTDYLRKISLKMLTLETKFQNTGSHSMQSQTLAEQQRSLRNIQHQQQQNQLSGQQKNVSDLQQNQQQQQQQQQQRLRGQQNSLSNMQQQQQQQQLLGQQNNISNLNQQKLGSQNGAGLQQQQLIGTQSGVSNMQSQQSLHMLSQQAEIGWQQQKTAQAPSTMMQMPGQHSQSQPLLQSLMPQLQPQAGPYQQQLGLQHQLNTLQRDMQQRLHLSGVQLQNVMEQKQIQSQRVLPEASSTSIDSTTQTGNANTAEWQEEAYQKIKAMNDMYLPDLTEMYQKVCAKLQQQEVLTQPKEQIEKLKSLKLYLEHMLHFLQVAKNNIPACYKEKLDSYEKQIGRFLNSHRGKKPIPSHQGQQQLQTSGGHALSMPHQQQPQSQISQLQQHENHMNPQMQPMNIPNSGTSVQPSAVTSMPHGTLPSLSTQLGVPATQANVMSSLQSGSALDMGQGSASSSLQLGGVGSRQQNTIAATQQAYINTLSQSGVNGLQHNFNSLQMMSIILQQQHLKQQQEQQLMHLQQMKHQSHQCQMHQQLIQQQHLQLQLQQHPQLRQQSAQFQAHQMPQLQLMSEDMKMRQVMGFEQLMAPQHHSAGQHTTYHPPQLKPGAQFPISSPQLLPAPSPQHFSPQIDQQNLLTSFPKSGTPLQSANSLFIVPSPSTPLAPSPIPGDSEKQASCISSPSNTGHVGHPQATAALAPAHSLAIGTPGINVFCERTDLEDKVDTTHGPAQCSMKGIFISCLIVIVFGFLLSLLAC